MGKMGKTVGVALWKIKKERKKPKKAGENLGKAWKTLKAIGEKLGKRLKRL